MRKIYKTPEIIMNETTQIDVLSASDLNSENSETIEGLLGGETNPFN